MSIVKPVYRFEETPREAWVKMCEWFNADGARLSRLDKYAGCMYRSGKQKCAVGCLIPDDAYDPIFDSDDNVSGSAGVEDMCDMGFFEVKYGKLMDFLVRAQDGHDKAADIESFRAWLRDNEPAPE